MCQRPKIIILTSVSLVSWRSQHSSFQLSDNHSWRPLVATLSLLPEAGTRWSLSVRSYNPLDGMTRRSVFAQAYVPGSWWAAHHKYNGAKWYCTPSFLFSFFHCLPSHPLYCSLTPIGVFNSHQHPTVYVSYPATGFKNPQAHNNMSVSCWCTIYIISRTAVQPVASRMCARTSVQTSAFFVTHICLVRSSVLLNIWTAENMKLNQPRCSLFGRGCEWAR